MKNLKYIFGSLVLSIGMLSCSTESVNEDSQLIMTTGDQADDPIEPDDEDSVFVDNFVSSTGDQADDPIEPDDED